MSAEKLEERQYTGREGTATMGRAPVWLDCPFCARVVKAFKWSLAGSGKKCSCGAKFGGYGIAYKLSDPEEER